MGGLPDDEAGCVTAGCTSGLMISSLPPGRFGRIIRTVWTVVLLWLYAVMQLLDT